MLETMLSKIGLPVLVNIVSQVLKEVPSPIARGAAEALDKVDEALKAGHISTEQMIEANRHIEKLAELQSEEVRANLTATNETIRAEIASEDKYIRRMRPTFGYLMAITWAAQMLGIAYVIIFDTQRAASILSAMASLSAIWGVELSVLGIYVYKRSEDKKLIPPPETIFWK